MSRTLNVIKLACATGLVVSMLPVSASAASTYYLQLDGIDGESTSKDHPKWINVDSFDWSITSQSAGGGGSGSGKASFSDFSWTQQLDKSVTGLFNDISTGKAIKTATLDLTTSGSGGQSQTYFEMIFGNAFLTNVSLAGSGGDKPFVAASLNYDTVTLNYWVINSDGSKGAKTTASYDLITGKGSVSALTSVFALGLLGPTEVSPVSEPQSYALMLAGLVAMIWRFRVIRAKFQ